MKLLIGLFVVVLFAVHSSFATFDTVYGQSDNVVKRSYFLVSTPKVWMSAVESVCLVVFRAISVPNAVITVNVESMTSGEVFVQNNYPFNSLSQCVEIPVRNIRSGRALVRVQLADIVNETLVVKIKPSKGITLIETSKPIYRTNEYLQFRVITLNDWLRPIDEQFSQIVVENANTATVMQWNDVKTVNGIVSLQMPIAENNAFGVWKIRAYSAQNSIADKIFKVMDYETPNILIDVESPNYVLSNYDSSINSKICVTNSYGEALNGQLNGVVSYFRFNFDKPGSLARTALPAVVFAENINGCYNLALQSTQLNWTSTKYSQLSLKLSVQFRDQSSGFSEEKYIEIPLVQSPLNIVFPSVKLMKQYFKPGLPYFGYMVVSLPDYSYAADEGVNVCYETRQVPWLSGSVPPICERVVSDVDGLIHFTIPPVPTLNNTFAIKQIVVTAQSVKYPDVQNQLVLEPAFSASNEYIALRPKIHRNYCNHSVEFDVLFNRPLAATEYQNIYYQILGSGVIHSPQMIALKPSHRWTNLDDRHLIGSRLCENCDIPVAKMTVTLPQSPLNNNIINRLLLYYLDLKGNIVADSNVFLTTCLDHNQHSTRINLNSNVDGGYAELSVASNPGSVCSVRVSQNKPYSSVKKLNEFIERFNTQRQELSVRDNCELYYEMKRRQSQAPYDSSYGLQDTNTAYEPVLNFGDAWDSFNGIGLLVSSNAGLDNCPCEWDLYDKDVLTQLRAKRISQLNSVNRRAQRFVRIQLQELEKSLLNEILYWDVLNIQDKTHLRRISSPLISTADQLYSDALCVSKQHGITYTRNHFKHQLDDSSLRLLVEAPQTARLGETLVYKVYARKAKSSCYPIQIELENSSQYKLVDSQLVSPFCFCGTQSQPLHFKLQPEYVGTIDVRISAVNPLSLGVYNVSSVCGVNQLAAPLLLPQTISKRLVVGPQRVVLQSINSHVICNNNRNVIDNELVKHQLPEYVQNSANSVLSSDIVTPVIRYLRWKRSNGLDNNNAFDTLSTFAASYYLYDYLNSNHLANNRQQHEPIFVELRDELSKSYQTLINYQRSDGSYSLSTSSQSPSNGDIALSAAVFKVLSQSRRHLNYIQDTDLMHTLRWIYSQQLENGCFNAQYARHNQQNIWPLNFDNNYDLTGYIIVSLLDSGLDFDSPSLINAYQCFLNNTLMFTEDIKPHLLSTTFYAYIQALNGNTEQLSQVLSKLSAHREYILDASNGYSSEILSYLSLAYQLANDRSEAINIGQLLLRQPRVWQTPINCYAAIKLWPIMRINATTFQVYGENDALVSTLALNKTHSLAGNQKIALRNNGCVLISTSNAINKTFTGKTNYFEVDINNLERGYSSCRKRLMNICIKKSAQTRAALNPVVRMQLISGFQIDRKLMKKMIDRDVISSYKTVNGELIIFLQKLAAVSNSNSNSGFGEKPECVAIPLIQREDISGAIHGLVTVYDYYNDDINDVTQYTLPQQCSVELEDEKSRLYYGGAFGVARQHYSSSGNKIDQNVYNNVNSI